MRALNIFAMITVAFFFVLALFLKPVVMDTGEILSEPVERRCTEDEVVKMNESKLTNGVDIPVILTPHSGHIDPP